MTKHARSVSRGRSTTKRTRTNTNETLRSKSRSKSRPVRKTRKHTTVGKSVSFNQSSTGGMYKAAEVKKNRKLDNKKKVAPKVSKEFKEKVHKALDSEMVHGSVTLIYPTGTVAATQIPANAQFAWNGANTSNNVDQHGWHFTVDYFIKCASLCFNSALMGTTTATWVPSLTNLSLSPTLTKMWIRKSWSTYKLKNNTQRVIIIQVHEIAPKAPLPANITNGVAGGVKNIAGIMTETADTLGAWDPTNQWNTALTDDYNNGAMFSTISGGPLALATTTLDTSPANSKSFKNVFKTGMIREFKMEPGQEAEFNLPGPSCIEMDSSKYWREAFLNSLQKFSRGIIMIAKNDQVSGLSVVPAFVSAGRWPSFAVNSAIAIERKDFCIFDLPESSVATTNPVNVGITYATGRRDVHVHEIIIPIATAVTSAVQFDEDNPIAAINP